MQAHQAHSFRVIQWREHDSRLVTSGREEGEAFLMATDTITIHLPDDLHKRLERLAHLTGQPVEGLIVRTLSSNLPPLPEDLPPATRDALQALERLDNTELLQLTNAKLPKDQYEQLTTLRELRRERALTPHEEATLNRLLEAADLLTLKMAYAAVLLKWRGQQLSPYPR